MKFFNVIDVLRHLYIWVHQVQKDNKLYVLNLYSCIPRESYWFSVYTALSRMWVSVVLKWNTLWTKYIYIYISILLYVLHVSFSYYVKRLNHNRINLSRCLRSLTSAGDILKCCVLHNEKSHWRFIIYRNMLGWCSVWPLKID